MNASDILVYTIGAAALMYVLRYATRRLFPGLRLFKGLRLFWGLRMPAPPVKRVGKACGDGHCDGCG